MTKTSENFSEDDGPPVTTVLEDGDGFSVVEIRRETPDKPRGEDGKAKVAARRRAELREVTWRDTLLTNDRGVARPIAANVVAAFAGHPRLVGIVAHNEFSGDTMLMSRPPWDKGEGPWAPRVWTDADDRDAAVWLQFHASVFVDSGVVAQGIDSVARRNSFHPVRAYLDGLVWDGVPRLDNWLKTYCGVEADTEGEPSRYVKAVGARWMIGAVARAYRPGEKLDTMLILEGPQGFRKSTAVKTLCPEPSLFTDELAEFGSKDAALQLRGVWIIEVSELDTMSRSEVKTVKAFMSRTADRFRPPYGRRLVDQPRQVAFFGTVNPGGTGYLEDSTGNRRFWPATCRRPCDTEGLAQVRDQLWAEAVTRYKAGEPWWLDAELEALAAGEQSNRLNTDAWHGTIETFVFVKDFVTIDEIFSEALSVPVERRDQKMQNRVARTLQILGFERTQRRVNGRQTWGYVPTKRQEPPKPYDDVPF